MPARTQTLEWLNARVDELERTLENIRANLRAFGYEDESVHGIDMDVLRALDEARREIEAKRNKDRS
jgi:transketolase N-terminal domain/subunit